MMMQLDKAANSILYLSLIYAQFLAAEGVEQTGTLGSRRRGSSPFSCFLVAPPFPWKCYLYWAGIYLLPPLYVWYSASFIFIRKWGWAGVWFVWGVKFCIAFGYCTSLTFPLSHPCVRKLPLVSAIFQIFCRQQSNRGVIPALQLPPWKVKP